MNKKIAKLLKLGETDNVRNWPNDDYAQYGFTEADVPDLISIISDSGLHKASVDSYEVWAPLHAWRVLGHLQSVEAIQPLIDQYDILQEDDWAIAELSKVMGMMGGSAIEPLARYFKEQKNIEFSRVMALDGLAEIAKKDPQYRQRVLDVYQSYMVKPRLDQYDLNGLLIAQLMDLKAVELIDDIHHMFALDCVDIGIPGDLEDVEISLGLRFKRETAKPNYNSHRFSEEEDESDINLDSDVFDNVVDDDVIDKVLGHFYDDIERFFEQYGSDYSILDVSELDGFFAAIACSPKMIPPSQWMPAIWGGEEHSPEWENIEDAQKFAEYMIMCNNNVIGELQHDELEPLYLERAVNGETYTVVDEWCEGFVRGLYLWLAPEYQHDVVLEECLMPISLFIFDEDKPDKLEDLTLEEIKTQQDNIKPRVNRLYQHFSKYRTQVADFEPFVRDTPKVGRNDPCPCGSGKKFKRCCLH